MADKDERYTVVSRPASNKNYRTGVLLDSDGNVFRTCGHTITHTTSKAAVDCMRNAVKNETNLKIK